MGRFPRIGAALPLAAVAALAVFAAGASPSRSAVRSTHVMTTPATSPKDVLEDGVSGEVPLLDQLDGKAALGYHRGIETIGTNSLGGRGSNFSLAWVGTCAYVGTTSGNQLEGFDTSPYLLPGDSALNGVAVIDVSNPRAPKYIETLRSVAMLDPHESLQGNDARKFFIATASQGNEVDIYDARDCTHPVLASVLTIGVGYDSTAATQGYTFRGHALCLSPDGTMAYATGTPYNNAAIDLTDLAHPVVKQLFVPASHDCGVSPDGKRLYLAVFGGALYGPQGQLFSEVTDIRDSAQGDLPEAADDIPYWGSNGFNGLLILDSSAFAEHLKNPQFKIVGQLPWTPESEGETPFAGSHTARFFQRNGQRFIFSNDEWPITGVCPWAHSRIIDITNEAHPVKIADITLGVQEIANCTTTEKDVVNYSAHYAGIDNPLDASLLFTTDYGAGLRVYDIRNPYKPVEIAYDHPAPIGGEPINETEQAFGGNGTAWEAVPTYVHYVPQTGDFWIAGFTTGFSVLHLTSTARPL